MSRLTLRPKNDIVCWQKTVRDKYNYQGIPDVNLSLKNAIVRPISRKLAKQIILKYEWLGTMTGSTYHYGIFFDHYCAGVTCVNSKGTATAGPYLNMALKIDKSDLLELARGACVHWSPKGSNSKLVSWTCKLLKGKGKIILAFSDTDAGEIGTIYQACNWVYIGKGTSVDQLVTPNGNIYNQKIIGDIADKKKMVSWKKQKEALLKAGYKTQKSNPKHKYVYVIDKDDKQLVEHIQQMKLPYPKRAPKA